MFHAQTIDIEWLTGVLIAIVIIIILIELEKNKKQLNSKTKN